MYTFCIYTCIPYIYYIYMYHFYVYFFFSHTNAKGCTTYMVYFIITYMFTLLLLTCLLYYYLHVYFTITYMYTLLLLTCILQLRFRQISSEKKQVFFVSNDTEAESVVFVSLVLRWFIQRLSHARLGCIGVCVCVCV